LQEILAKIGEGTNKPEDSMNDTAAYTVDSSVNSIIGEGTTLRGDFDLNGLLRIDGTFYGKVRTSGRVLIGRNGRAECDLIAGTIVIGGKVKGEIIAAERITLLSTGVLIGNIVTPRLIIEEGVIFNGRCEIVEDKDRLEKIKQEHLVTRGTANSNAQKTVSATSDKEEWTGLKKQPKEKVLSTPLAVEERFTPRVEQKVT
jgi:cytoskeletal protein CcmA (bactofilin family)